MDCSTKRLDLTDQQYGDLTVLHPAANVDGRTAWLCRCSCGRETVVKTKNLRSGHQSTCGVCRKRGIEGLTYVDGTCVEMLRTRTIRRNNTSGFPGVDHMVRKGGSWRATICFKGKRYYLGSYKTFDEAVQARQEAEVAYFDNFLREFASASRAKAEADSNID